MDTFKANFNSYNALHPQQTLLSSNEASIINLSDVERKRRILTTEGKELVLHVFEMCDFERSKDGLLKPLSEFATRAAIYTGVTEETIEAIQSKNWKSEKPKEIVSGDGKRGPKIKKQQSHKAHLDDRGIVKIKEIIRDYCIENCKIPTITELLPRVLDQIPIYETNVKFLWRVLHNIGYRRKKLFSKRAVLLENPEAVSCRDNYLKTIRQLRGENKNIFYIYECIIDNSYTFFKAWAQKCSNNDVLQNKHTYLLMCAASETGFLKQTIMLCKPNFNEVGRLNNSIFEKWLKGDLISHLPKNSIVIMDDAPHHCELTDKPLSYCASKQEMLKYLEKKNIKCDEKMRRIELYTLIQEHAPQEKMYIIDDILKEHGHKAMRLPPYMTDLNPAQLAMDKIQYELYKTEYDKVFNLKNVTQIMTDLMTAVTSEDWKSFFEKTGSLEDHHWKKDGEFEVAMDKILENLQNCYDSESEKSSTGSDADEDL